MTTISGTQQIIAQSEMFCYIDSCRFQVAADVLPDRIGKGVRLRFSIPRARLIVDNAAVEGQIHGHHAETGFSFSIKFPDIDSFPVREISVAFPSHFRHISGKIAVQSTVIPRHPITWNCAIICSPFANPIFTSMQFRLPMTDLHGYYTRKRIKMSTD